MNKLGNGEKLRNKQLNEYVHGKGIGINQLVNCKGLKEMNELEMCKG